MDLEDGQYESRLESLPVRQEWSQNGRYLKSGAAEMCPETRQQNRQLAPAVGLCQHLSPLTGHEDTSLASNKHTTP